MGRAMAYDLVCPECGATFVFEPPVALYVGPSAMSIRAPARCPNDHVKIYTLTELEEQDGRGAEDS